MYANVKRIIKPVQKQDFYLLSGESVPPDAGFPSVRTRTRDFWQFKYIGVGRALELAKDGKLTIRRRVEIKAELRKTFRSGGKVSSKTWHLASILERDVSDPIKCETFWRKIDAKLKTFDLSQAEETKIREKIEIQVPRQRNISSGQ
jgi:hypothetical protein